MFIERVAPEELRVKVVFKFEDGDVFYKFTRYTVWVTLVLRGSKFEYKTRTTVGFPNKDFEAEITRLAKKAALEIGEELMSHIYYQERKNDV